MLANKGLHHCDWLAGLGLRNACSEANQDSTKWGFAKLSSRKGRWKEKAALILKVPHELSFQNPQLLVGLFCPPEDRVRSIVLTSKRQLGHLTTDAL
jgi:hypothetical protein